MYRILDESSNHTIGIKVQGKLTKEDSEGLIPYLENRITEDGQINLVWDMTDFTGMEIEGFWEDLRLGMQHFGVCNREAVVGDQKWVEWFSKTIKPLGKTEIHYFSPDQVNEAWIWAQS